MSIDIGTKLTITHNTEPTKVGFMKHKNNFNLLRCNSFYKNYIIKTYYGANI